MQARRALQKQADRLGVTRLQLENAALWNLVAELEGASLEEAREIAGVDKEKS